MTLTPAQKTRLLRKFGDSNQNIFSEDELIDIWDEVSSASDDIQRYQAALYLMFESILNSATKLHDYTSGATGEKLSQVVGNLKGRVNEYKPFYESATSQQTDFARTVLRKRPHQRRTRPSTDREQLTRYNSTLDDRDY